MTNERYAFASDLDGDLCLIAPAGTTDWVDWVVESTSADDKRERISPAEGFRGHAHNDAEASWPIENLCHVEVSIPGLDMLTVHPREGLWCLQGTCPVCGWDAENARREHAERLAREAHEAARDERADQLVEIAEDEADTSQYRTSLRLLDTALEMYKSTGNAAAYADTLLDAGGVLLRAGRRTESLEAIQSARRILGQVGSRRDQASAAKLLADTLSDLREFDRSIELYNEAQERFGQLADWQMVATIEMEMGIVLERMGKFRDARDRYDQALKHYRHMVEQYNLDIARCQQNFSTTLRKLKDYDQAEQALREARATYVASGMIREAADCDVNLGNLRWSQCKLEEARELYEAAQPVYQQLELPTEAADCYDSIGGLLTDLGDYEAALPHHLRARATYDEYYFHIESAVASYNYAHALFHLGRCEEADAEIERTISAYESHNAEYRLSSAELLRASILSSLDRHDEAFALVDAARQRYHSLSDDDDAPGCDIIQGEVLRKAGRASEAVPYLERAIESLNRSQSLLGTAEAELELALTLNALDDAEAKTHADRSREIFQSLNLPLRVQEVSRLMGEAC